MSLSKYFALAFVSLLAFQSKAGLFDGIKTTAPRERYRKTQDIYNKQVRFSDSVSSIRSLNELRATADDLHDKSLQCLSVSLLADQYARYRQENPLSTRLHQEAIQMAESAHLRLMVGICTYRLGRYYYNFKKYPLAFEFMLRADNIFREIGYSEVPDIDEILFFLGTIYYETGDLEKSERFLQAVQHRRPIGKYVNKQSLNTLALIRRQQGDTANALVYFQKTLEASIAQQDSTWMGICYSNIGALYFHQGRYETAYPLLQMGATLCLRHRQWPDAYADLLRMARINILAGRMAEGQRKMDSAVTLHPHYNAIVGRKILYETQALLYERTGRTGKALETMHLLMQVKDSISNSKDHQAYQKVLMRLETEQHLNELDRIEAGSRSDSIKRNAVIAVLGLLVVVLLLLYNRIRMKAQNEAAALQAEKRHAEEQLKNARQMLDNFTEHSRQKNELIEQFAAEMQRLKSNLTGDPLYEERLQNFDKLVHSSLLTDAEWSSFQLLFDKVHKGFFNRLAQKLPGLSVMETRLAALVKLELSNKEMARMMGMKEDEIANAKQHLRSRIHPSEDGLALEDLVHAV